MIHTGAICIASGCDGTNRFAGDFITSTIDSTGAAHLAWISDATGTATIRYQRIQSGVISSYVPPACGTLPIAVQLNGVVSRKTHGSAGSFNIDLPVTGSQAIECRSGGANGDYTLIVTFANTLTGVGGARVSSGNGQVKNGAIGSDAHQYVVNLTGVTDAQHIFVTLRGVSDSAGNYTDAISASMGVLLADVNANGLVNSTDASLVQSQSGQSVTSSNFRMDINVNGLINSTNTSIVRSKSGTGF